MNPQKCVDALLAEATFDWISTADFLSVAKKIGGGNEPDAMERIALQLIREVIKQELMVIGDLPKSDTGQRPQPLIQWHGSPDEWLERVEREWPQRRGSAEYGVYCWFENSPKGEERGQKLLKEKNRK